MPLLPPRLAIEIMELLFKLKDLGFIHDESDKVPHIWTVTKETDKGFINVRMAQYKNAFGLCFTYSYSRDVMFQVVPCDLDCSRVINLVERYLPTL